MDPAEIPLRGLHLPAEIGWWPLAPGWWIVIALVLLALGVLAFRAYRRFVLNSARRFALRQVDSAHSDFLQHGNVVRFAVQLSELLRRSMLAYAPRSDMAGLTGSQWSGWLDRGLATPVFSSGAGSQLLELPYRNPDGDFGDIDVDAMLAAVRERIRTPVSEAGS